MIACSRLDTGARRVGAEAVPETAVPKDRSCSSADVVVSASWPCARTAAARRSRSAAVSCPSAAAPPAVTGTTLYVE